jgi:hypothetical protein
MGLNGGNVVTLRTGRALLPTNIIIFMFLVLISVRGWANTRALRLILVKFERKYEILSRSYNSGKVLAPSVSEPIFSRVKPDTIAFPFGNHFYWSAKNACCPLLYNSNTNITWSVAFHYRYAASPLVVPPGEGEGRIRDGFTLRTVEPPFAFILAIISLQTSL